MKIMKADAGMLTDFEVLDLLRGRGAKSDPISCLGVVTSSECKVYDYLIHGAACSQTREGIENFKKRYQEFLEKNQKVKLTKVEILNIINLRPSGTAELYSIIPNLEACFDISDDGSSDVLDDFLSLIQEALPPLPETDAAKAMQQN